MAPNSSTLAQVLNILSNTTTHLAGQSKAVRPLAHVHELIRQRPALKLAQRDHAGPKLAHAGAQLDLALYEAGRLPVHLRQVALQQEHVVTYLQQPGVGGLRVSACWQGCGISSCLWGSRRNAQQAACSPH